MLPILVHDMNVLSIYKLVSHSLIIHDKEKATAMGSNTISIPAEQKRNKIPKLQLVFNFHPETSEFRLVPVINVV